LCQDLSPDTLFKRQSPGFRPSVLLGVVSLSFDLAQDSELVELSNHQRRESRVPDATIKSYVLEVTGILSRRCVWDTIPNSSLTRT
jgi:hypothetical protein